MPLVRLIDKRETMEWSSPDSYTAESEVFSLEGADRLSIQIGVGDVSLDGYIAFKKSDDGSNYSDGYQRMDFSSANNDNRDGYLWVELSDVGFKYGKIISRIEDAEGTSPQDLTLNIVVKGNE